MFSVSTRVALGSYFLKPSRVCVVSVPYIHREDETLLNSFTFIISLVVNSPVQWINNIRQGPHGHFCRLCNSSKGWPKKLVETEI